MSKKNTTVNIDTETLAEFKVIAERTGTTLSRLVNSKVKQWIKEQKQLEKLEQRAKETDND